MKKVITVFLILMCSSIVYSQNFQIKNFEGDGKIFSSSKETKWYKWTIENLQIHQNGDLYDISYKVYTVRESDYNEISNDTTYFSYDGTFEKLTKKDGSGYTFKCIKDNTYFYTISITEHKFISEKYPDRNDHYYNVMIHYQVMFSGYCVTIKLSPEEFELFQIK